MGQIKRLLSYSLTTPPTPCPLYGGAPSPLQDVSTGPFTSLHPILPVAGPHTGAVEGLHQSVCLFPLIDDKISRVVGSGIAERRDPDTPRRFSTNSMSSTRLTLCATDAAMIRLVVGQMNHFRTSPTRRSPQPTPRNANLWTSQAIPTPIPRVRSELVMNVIRFEHWLVLLRPILSPQTTFDATLAILYFLLSTLAHSKCPPGALRFV